MTEKPKQRRDKVIIDAVDDGGRESGGKTPRVWLRPRIPYSTKDAVDDFRRELKKLDIKIDYEVGYGKPPKNTRFQPGVSGNPSGLRKKKDRGLDVRALVQDAFLSEVSVREGKGKAKLPYVVAVIKQKQKEALHDLKTFRELMRLAERLGVFSLIRKPKRDYSDMTPEQREKAITAYYLMYEAGLVRDTTPKKGS